MAQEMNDPTETSVEEGEEYMMAMKAVLRRQMRDLVQQFRENGEEVAVLAVNVAEDGQTSLGTPLGEWFLSTQSNLTHDFLNFCKGNADKSQTGNIKTGQVIRAKMAVQKPGTVVPKLGSPVKPVASKTQNKVNVQVTATPIIKVTIPRLTCEGVSDQQQACIVGRIIAAHLVQEPNKGDGSSSGSKFDSILEASQPNKERSTPVRATRSGRKTVNKYLESLKKGKAIKQEIEEETTDLAEETVIIHRLNDIEPVALKKVEVRIGKGTVVDLHKWLLEGGDVQETLACTLLQTLTAHTLGNISDKKHVKVFVRSDVGDSLDEVQVEVSKGLTKGPKNEDMDDSDTEYTDFMELGALDADLDDSCVDDAEPTQHMEPPDGKQTETATEKTKGVSLMYKIKPKKAVGVNPRPVSPTPSPGPVKKKKYLKPLSERMPMECEHCGQYVAGKSNLKSHIRRVHLKVKNHKCTICTKGFWSNNALESHMLSVHTRRCDNCQEYVVESVPWGTGIHMRMKRDVICTCGSIVSIFSSFGRRRTYMREEELDEEELPPSRPKSNSGTKYACGTCGKLFMKKSNCERHSRAHSDYKGIICNICGSSFAYENSLKRHMETEHGIMKHACDLCGKNYSNDTALKVHIIKAHTQENVSIGENLVMIVKEKPGATADLSEQMEEIMEGEGDGTENGGLAGATEHIVVTQRADGSTEQVMVSGVPTSTQDLVLTGDDQQMLVSQADISQLEVGQVMVTQGEGGQVHVTTGDANLSHDSAQRIVQQAIQDGHVIASQDGNMSIIIKHAA